MIWVAKYDRWKNQKIVNLKCSCGVQAYFLSCTFWVTQTDTKNKLLNYRNRMSIVLSADNWKKALNSHNDREMAFYWRKIESHQHLYFPIFSAWESAIFGDGGQSYSGSPSPPLSDDGNVSSSSSVSSNDQKYIIKQNHHKLKINQLNGMKIHIRRGQRTTSLSASDEGIVMDYGEEVTRKKKVSQFSSFPF